MADAWDWVGEREKEIEEEREKGYFKIREGTQQFMLRGPLKTVDSYRAGHPNRDKPHFGDA